MFSSAVVSDDALTGMTDALKAVGVEGVTSQTSVDPIAELKVILASATSKFRPADKEATRPAAAALRSRRRRRRRPAPAAKACAGRR